MILHTEKTLGIVMIMMLAFSCVEPFSTHSLGFDQAIVVEGRFTNVLGKHHIKLSYTRPVDENVNVVVTGAQVRIEGSDGTKIDLIESEPGYYTSNDEIAGVPGTEYELIFTTSNGKLYRSAPQKLIASPPIDSVYNVFSEKVNSETGALQKGIQFFIDTHDDTEEAKYFKYEWEETYEVHSSYPSLYIRLSDPDTVVLRPEPIHICYATDKSLSIQIATTSGSVENRLAEVPVRYISSETDQLKYTYSILVRQYVIGAEAYGFYREINANNTDNGSLFDKQPGVVTGNVISVENPEETVLGFFEVSGVAENRVFVEYKNLDSRFPWPNDRYPCFPEQVETIYTYDSLQYFGGLGFEITAASYLPGGNFKAMLAPLYCTDCRFRGAATKPDFWIF